MPPPGGRNHRYKSRGIYSTRFSPGRRAWAKFGGMEWTLHILDPIEKETEFDPHAEDRFEGGANMKLMINFASMKFPIRISLTGMTVEELKTFRSFVNLAVTTALPVVQQRTQDAEEARIAGDSSLPRLYRAIPQFFVRQGSEYRNSTRVRSGLDWPAELEQEPEVLADGVRGPGGELPQRDPYLDSPEDYVQAANDIPILRPLGWVPDGTDGVHAAQAPQGDAASTARWNRRRSPNDRVVLLDGDEGDDHDAVPHGDENQRGAVDQT